ncbi:MAG: glycosyltransferase family 4 protein [Stenomitos rutilans HA7619-LM2]|jgi:glycosyltransferase involved in cell wall biosynthesis|nr:glycosyltransferase family 4 protein [Stenomitos rutilans HA7619-LM2]
MTRELTFKSSSGSFEVCFNPKLLAQFPKVAHRVALLVTSEYEGIFRNGGIGTYYRTLSEKLTAEGWTVVLLLCQSQERFGGESHLPALKHIFSTSECQDVLALQPMHLAILSQFQEWEWVDRENYCALFFAQAIAVAFERSFIYIEFPETLGLGHRTVQAKRAGVLGKHCFTAVTLHSGQEWLLEAHRQYTFPVPAWSLQISHYEQASFEQADLAFFPSHFLKAKVARYGWKTDHALHLPYFVPEVEQSLALEPLRDDLRQALKTDRMPVIFFGRLEERKGLITFIEALQLLDVAIAEKIQILFIGKNVQLQVEALKHLDSGQYIRQELGSSYSYHILADLYSREAIQLISQLTHPIVCLTSHQENFPNAALEMGQLPVSLVVSDTGGFRETLKLIKRSHDVRWFAPGDENSLAQSLKQAIATHSDTPSTPSKDSIYKTNQLLLYRRLKYLNLVTHKAKTISSITRNSGQVSQSLQNLSELERPQEQLSASDQELFPLASDKLSMLSSEERFYLQSYAKNEYTGSGEIVDLGCWLGSSTIPLAIGLASNLKVEAREERIHAYDIFIWRPSYMDQHLLGTASEGKYKEGDSFVEEFVERIHPWSHSIQVYPGDLNRIGWDQRPIEFLFIDAMKSWDLATSIHKSFFPSLVPGLSLVVHQDFAHFYCVWIHLIMYRLRDYLVPLEEHPFLYSSKIFRYVKAIPEALLQPYSLASFSEAEAEAAFAYSLALTPKKLKPNVAAVKVMYFIQMGDVERAKAELSQARTKYDRSEWMNLVEVEEWLERGDWFIPYR